jgi:polyisoprenyl-teichoic acid--peptidoglycan teichoic acid transferase
MPINSIHTNHHREDHDVPVAPTPRKKSLYWWKIGGSLFIAVIVIIGIIGYKILAAVNSTGNDNERVSVLQQLSHLVMNRDAQLKGESQDRVNILLLGIGGEGHDGPLLTDTIIFASVKPSTGQVTLLSIPRDLAVELPRYGIRKINHANAYGKEMDYPGGGEQLAADIVAKTIGQPVNYFIRMDFDGFKDIIDGLGGITVNVENSFTDSQYPTSNYGYQTIKFTAGTQRMSGDTALTYVRSRHGNNGEGSDFARSRRQQLVLEAVKDKIFSVGTLLNAGKIGSTLTSLGTHTRTNLEVWEMLRIATIIQNGTGGITTHVLDNSTPNGFLKDATGTDGAYLLIPKDGTFRAIQAYAKDIFIQSAFASESAHIVIRNESGQTGGAQTVAKSLESLGFPTPTIDTTAVASSDAVTKLIDTANGTKPNSLQGLQDYLKITALSATALDSLPAVQSYENTINTNGTVTTTPGTTDFVIIIGKEFFTTTDSAYESSTYLRSGSTTNTSTSTNANVNKNSNTSVNKNSNKNTTTTKNSNVNKNTNANVNVNSTTNDNSNSAANVNSNTNS